MSQVPADTQRRRDFGGLVTERSDSWFMTLESLLPASIQFGQAILRELWRERLLMVLQTLFNPIVLNFTSQV